MLTKFTSKHCVIILCLFVAVVIIFHSCKKDHGNADEQFVQKLSSWYKSNIKVSQNSSFSKLSPQWDNIEVIEESDQKIYEIGLNNPEKLILMSGETRLDNLEQEEKKHNIRLLIFENKQTGQILYGCYMSVANAGGQNIPEVHYKNVGILTGTITFYNLDGALANGWQYANGKLTKVISASTKLQYEAMMQKNAIGAKGKIMDNGRPPYCLTRIAPRYRIGCVGVSGYERCSYLFDGWDYSDICSYFDNDDGLTQTGGGSGGSGGDYYPPIKDCNGVDGGSAYFDSNCGCIGGTTGIVSCKDIMNKTTDPCISKTVKAALDANKDVIGMIGGIISLFDASKTVTLNIYDGATEHGTPGQYKGGSFVNNVFQANITLQTSYFKNSSKESVISTLIHESVHAYIHTSGSKILEEDHEAISKKYIEPMAAYLQNYFGMNIKDAYSMAWSGVADSKAYIDAKGMATFKMSDGNTITKDEIDNLALPYKDNGNDSQFKKGTPICN